MKVKNEDCKISPSSADSARNWLIGSEEKRKQQKV